MGDSQGQLKREGFSSGLAIFFDTLGSAVGLGNIWKFPYLTGQFGGGAFLLVYFSCIILVGLPVMLSEFYLGRSTRKNVVGAFDTLRPGTAWRYTGIMSVLAVYLIMFFYSCVAGWVYLYLFKALSGDFAGITAAVAKVQFAGVVVGPWSPIIWQVIVMATVSAILIMGVKKGIERITKTLMPLLFILILLCDIRALTLPGAGAGIDFLFNVDFGKITPPVILTAMGLAFFKLSLGLGAMVTYSSYFTHDNNLFGTATKVALSDTLVSMLAGLAIFPAVFSFGMEPGAGPGLLFMTIPLVFSQMPFGNILLVAFFFLSSIAATTAMLSLVEVAVAYFVEEKGFGRKTAVIINAIVILVFGVLAALSADSSALLGQYTIFGKGFFDFFDYVSSNILLPVGGLLIAVFVGYLVNPAELRRELTNDGAIPAVLFEAFYFIIRYITPALLILVFLNSIGVVKL